ncbi:MAG: HupE/UreJ family protein, partial [Terrimicrobiaceae bacterium]
MKNMMHNRRTILFLLLLYPITAFAHTGGGETIGFWSGLEHPISGLDHILAMVAVGLWGGATRSACRVAFTRYVSGSDGFRGDAWPRGRGT